MSTFGQRIKQARLEAGLSQEALAEAMSQLIDKKRISRTAITQWESSKTKGIEASNLLKATKVLNVMPDWLQFGSGSMRPIPAANVWGVVPLLSDIQAANPMGKIKELTSHVGLDEQLAKMASPLAFALTVRDDSMAPLFVVGDIVIIDPSINPLPGEFVVAKIEEHHAVIFRKYRQLPQTAKSGGFELAALNGDWGKAVTSMDCSITIIGTLIEHRCRRRV